jgi:uncharacterized protein (TIGR02453 family)
MSFTGFPAEAFEFYERLGLDNSRTFWQANKGVYDTAVKQPMLEFIEAIGDYGPLQMFRPYRDVRFAKDKTPYKDHAGAYGESQGGTGYYVQLGAKGMFTGAGYYMMAADQLERFRAAVDGEATGSELVKVATAVEGKGLTLGAGAELKTAPRGFPKDHPRIEFLRRKGLFAGRDFPVAKWMHGKGSLAKLMQVWKDAAPLTDWLDAHVGPSTLPPEDWQR